MIVHYHWRRLIDALKINSFQFKYYFLPPIYYERMREILVFGLLSSILVCLPVVLCAPVDPNKPSENEINENVIEVKDDAKVDTEIDDLVSGGFFLNKNLLGTFKLLSNEIFL